MKIAIGALSMLLAMCFVSFGSQRQTCARLVWLSVLRRNCV